MQEELQKAGHRRSTDNLRAVFFKVLFEKTPLNNSLE